LSSINGNAISGARNRIINGDCRIDQRNAGASVTPIDGQYTLDRYQCWLSQSSKFSVQRTATAPVGFTSSILITSLSALSVGVNDEHGITQKIEGNNISDLNWGTADAKPVTLSFWVRSSITGNFGGMVSNGSSLTRIYPFNYTINSNNTWEYKTVTIPGETSGTWTKDETWGMAIHFQHGVGSNRSATAGTWVNGNALIRGVTGQTNLLATNGATWNMTGLQLEAGTVATPFERRSYGQELALCQRYFAKTYDTNVAVATAGSKSGSIFVYKNSANEAGFCFQMPVEMRSTPTIALYSHAGTVNKFTSSTTDQTSSSNGPINGTRTVMSYGTTVIATDCYQHFTCSAEL
jgi:hypothetical protein